MKAMIQTQLIAAKGGQLSSEDLQYVCQALAAGKLVAFPTETVYGLGANALDPDAVKRIFAAKGRPADNPLIVHIAAIKQVNELVTEFSKLARTLAEHFWPGPLTLILPASPQVPAVTRGGLPTVGIRMPCHPIALQILSASGLPVAAPSANTSGKPSPVVAQDVYEDLAGRIEVIVDGGPTGIGVESTVVLVKGDVIRVLRPGGITVEQLRQFAEVQVDPGAVAETPVQGPVLSPGMKYRHYAPEAPAVLVEGEAAEAVEKKVIELVQERLARGQRVGVMASVETCQRLREVLAPKDLPFVELMETSHRFDLAGIAANIYRCLRRFDHLAVDSIVMEGTTTGGIGLAIANRLRKAAGYNIVRV